MDPTTPAAARVYARAPSPDYPTAEAAIEAMVVDYGLRPDPAEAGWLTIAAGDAGTVVAQYVEGQVNFLQRDVELDDLLRQSGEAELAAEVTPARQGDRTLWQLAMPTPERVTRIVALALEHEFGFGADQPVEVTFDASGAAPPGSLHVSPSRLTLAGWGLLTVSLLAIAGFTTLFGPWVQGWAFERGLQKVLPLFVVLLMIPGLLTGVAVYLLGRRVLIRAGVPIERAEDVPPA